MKKEEIIRVSLVKIALVACCKKKLDHAAPARDLYQSTLFKLSRRYAEQQDIWFILSADHGLLWPDTVVKPYDKTLRQLDGARRAWAERVLDQLTVALAMIGINPEEDDLTWVVLAGKLYCEHIVDHLPGTVIVPLAGLSIGQQQRRLKELILSG